jgi:hypothetical protein
MEYLNIKLETVGDIRYVGSVPLVRATWLNLLIYCVKQENSGRIVNCASWGDHTWAQIAGLKRKEVHAASTLWDWDGADLVVWGYPIHNEHVCRVRREVGRSGGKASGASRRSSKEEANGEPIAEPIGSANGQATLEQKGKERKGKESNSTTTTTAPPALNRGCSIEEAREFALKHNGGAGIASGLQIPMPVVALWHDERTKVGWVTVKGQMELPIADWQADLRSFAQRYAQNEQRPAPANGYGRHDASKPAPKLSTQAKGAGSKQW